MKIVLGSVLVGLLGSLTACGGSSSGGSSSSGPIVAGPKEQDCGNPISLAKTYTKVTGYGATSRKVERTDQYAWSYPSGAIQEEYGTSNPNGEIDVRSGELIDACQWVQQSFSGIGPEAWAGEDDGVFPKNGDNVYFTPKFYFEFELPQYQTYGAWEQADKPETENATLRSARLTVGLSRLVNGRLSYGNDSSAVIEDTQELELSCESSFELNYAISRYTSLDDIEREMCDAFLINGSTVYDCLSSYPELAANSCTFKSDKIFVPDNKGNIYEAAISGKLYDDGLGNHRIEINGVDILN